MISSVYATLFFLFFTPSFFVNAQTTGKIFQWSFQQSLSASLPSCKELAITVKPFDGSSTTGVPPYYMHAYPPGGLPTTTLIGNDSANLQWTVAYPPDTELLLNVVDSNTTSGGTSGGVPPQLFKVVTNSALSQATQCIPSSITNPPKDFTVSANVTGSLQTCQQWGLTISGGVKPYNITLLAINSPMGTNVTTSGDEDAFTFVNRAEPNKPLIAGVSDLTGRWAFGTPMVETAGSDNADCVGLVSTSGFASELAKEAADRAQAAKRKKDTLLAGVLTPVFLILVVGCVAGWFWYKRRVQGKKEGGFGFVRPFRGMRRLASTDNMARDLEGAPSTAPEMEVRQDGTVLSIASYLNGSSSSAATTTSPSPPQPTMSSPIPTVITGATRSSSLNSSLNTAGARPAFTSFPRSSVRGAKAMEAGYSLQDRETSAGPPLESAALPSSQIHPSDTWQSRGATIQNPDSPSSDASVSPVSSGRDHQLPVPGQSNAGQSEEVVFQHTDSGMPGVRELPPPYMDERNGDP